MRVLYIYNMWIDDLMRSDIHKQWQYTIKRYADRVMLRF